MANAKLQKQIHQCHSHKKNAAQRGTADLRPFDCPTAINITITGRQNCVFGSACLKQAKESDLFNFIIFFFLRDRLGFLFFHEMGRFFIYDPRPSTKYHTNLTTNLFPQPSKVLRLMIKMTTAGKVLLLMNPLQWESPCLPFSARSVSE